jgi:hypothetical protein
MARREGPDLFSHRQALRSEDVLSFVQPLPIRRTIEPHRFFTAGLDEPFTVTHDPEGASDLEQFQSGRELQPLQSGHKFDLISRLGRTSPEADPFLAACHEDGPPTSPMTQQGTVHRDENGLKAHS